MAETEQKLDDAPCHYALDNQGGICGIPKNAHGGLSSHAYWPFRTDEPSCPFCGAPMEQKLTQVATNRFVMALACTAPCGESSYAHGLDMKPESWLPTLLHCIHCQAEIRGESMRADYAETWIGAHQRSYPGHIIVAGPRAETSIGKVIHE